MKIGSCSLIFCSNSKILCFLHSAEGAFAISDSFHLNWKSWPTLVVSEVFYSALFSHLMGCQLSLKNFKHFTLYLHQACIERLFDNVWKEKIADSYCGKKVFNVSQVQRSTKWWNSVTFKEFDNPRWHQMVDKHLKFLIPAKTMFWEPKSSKQTSRSLNTIRVPLFKIFCPSEKGLREHMLWGRDFGRSTKCSPREQLVQQGSLTFDIWLHCSYLIYQR